MTGDGYPVFWGLLGDRVRRVFFGVLFGAKFVSMCVSAQNGVFLRGFLWETPSEAYFLRSVLRLF